MNPLPLLMRSISWRAPLLAGCLALTIWLVAASPVAAADFLSPPDSLFAAWYSNFVSSLGTRSRVVQVCIVTMCVALFILMKKFVDPGQGPRR
ncbi:MAG: hypothetical protein U0840_01695 [Gemmataceae bacterium]